MKYKKPGRNKRIQLPYQNKRVVPNPNFTKTHISRSKAEKSQWREVMRGWSASLDTGAVTTASGWI